jgi:hypothetical protein
MSRYFQNIEGLGGQQLKGTKQQKRLLLALSMIYGDPTKGTTDMYNIVKG